MTGTAKVEIAGKAAVVEQEGKSVRVLLHEARHFTQHGTS